jgi:cytochrome c5
VSASHDRTFLDTFMIILGILAGVTVVLIILSRLVAGNAMDEVTQADPLVQGEIEARIAPVARVAVAGKDNSALTPPVEAVAVMADMAGDEVYNQACVACHGAGIAGAPKFGDAAAWGPRVAQGAETLHQHAIAGFQGKNGLMPPKGGRADLSDQSIMNAVDYIIANSK